MSSLNIVPIDMFFMVLALFITLRCIIKGFVSEFMAIASIAGGITAGIIFSAALSSLMDLYIGISRWNSIIAFLVIFLTVYIVIKILEKGIYSFIIKVGLEKLDRSLGLFLGLFESFILIFIIVALLEVQPFFNSERFLSGSRISDFMKTVIYIFYTHNHIPAVL